MSSIGNIIHLQARIAVAAKVFFFVVVFFNVFKSHTDLVVGAFHHSAGTQNLRLGSCGLYVLQVLLSDL